MAEINPLKFDDIENIPVRFEDGDLIASKFIGTGAANALKYLAGDRTWKSFPEQNNNENNSIGVPTYTPEDYIIPQNRQVLFSQDIICDGDLIIDGTLIQV